MPAHGALSSCTSHPLPAADAQQPAARSSRSQEAAEQALRFETWPAENVHKHVRPTAPGCRALVCLPARGGLPPVSRTGSASSGMDPPLHGWHPWTHPPDANEVRHYGIVLLCVLAFAGGEGMCARRSCSLLVGHAPGVSRHSGAGLPSGPRQGDARHLQGPRPE